MCAALQSATPLQELCDYSMYADEKKSYSIAMKDPDQKTDVRCDEPVLQIFPCCSLSSKQFALRILIVARIHKRYARTAQVQVI